MSEHGDLIDRAQAFETREREAVIEAHRRRRAGEAIAAAIGGDLTCVTCGDPIPAERRQALPHARRCVDCQTWEERR